MLLSTYTADGMFRGDDAVRTTVQLVPLHAYHLTHRTHMHRMLAKISAVLGCSPLFRLFSPFKTASCRGGGERREVLLM